MKRPALAAAGAAAATAIAVVVLVRSPSHDAVELTAAAPRTATGETLKRTGTDASRPARSTPSSTVDAARFRHWLATESSLRGAELDGSWDVGADGHLRPTRALRRRFDQLLTLLGEVPMATLTAFVAADAGAEVLALWQRYLALQQHRFSVSATADDRVGWSQVLAERRQVRRAVLGTHVAEVFYAEEEAQFAAALQGAAPAEPLSIEPATLDPAARERLRQSDAAWADWQARLADAQREIAALRAAPNLSATQRDAAIEHLIAERFNAAEAVRVRALVQSPPSR